MTDETPIVVNQDDDYDEDDHDPETCDEIDCYYAPTFEVEITRTVRYKIHAHTEDAALNFVWGNDVFTVSEPDGVEDFEDDSDEVSCRSEQEIMAEAARVRQTLAEMEAAEAAAAAAANPHADHDVWPLISKPGFTPGAARARSSTRQTRWPSMREGPWRAEEVIPLIDPNEEWHGGGPRPADLEARCAPGGLVFRLVRPDGQVLDEAVAVRDPSSVDAAAVRHGEACAADPSLRVIVWDGDSGRAILSMGAPSEATP